MANAETDRLERRRLILDRPYEPTAADNKRAWEAIEPLLRKAGDKGVTYELLSSAARAAAPSVTARFIPYLVRNGHLKVLPD